jgi:hypothetical protein
MYTRLVLLVTAACLLFLCLRLPAADADKKEKETKADYKVYDGYFESNQSGLKGKSSFLVFTDKKAFDKVFRPAPPLLGGKKKTMLPPDAFKTGIVVAVVKRGNQLWTYKVQSATSCKGKITLSYQAESRDGGSATFASPLIVALPGASEPQVRFEENGKEAALVNVAKEKE